MECRRRGGAVVQDLLLQSGELIPLGLKPGHLHRHEGLGDRVPSQLNAVGQGAWPQPVAVGARTQADRTAPPKLTLSPICIYSDAECHAKFGGPWLHRSGGHMSAVSSRPTRTVDADPFMWAADLDTAVRPPSLSEVLTEIDIKREVDVIRFRTCCADPRASK